MYLSTWLLPAILNDFTTDPKAGLFRETIESANNWAFLQSPIFVGIVYSTLFLVMLPGIVYLIKQRKKIESERPKSCPVWVYLSIGMPLLCGLLLINVFNTHHPSLIISELTEQLWIFSMYIASLLGLGLAITIAIAIAIALIVGFHGFMEYLFRECRIVKSVVGILIVSSLVGLAFIQNVPLIARISAGVLVLTVLPFLIFWLCRAIEMRRLISNSKQYRECMKSGESGRAFTYLTRAHCASSKYFDPMESHIIFGDILEKQGNLDWANHFYRMAMSGGDTLERGYFLNQRNHQLLLTALTVEDSKEVLTTDPVDLDSTVEDPSNDSVDDSIEVSFDANEYKSPVRKLIKRILYEAVRLSVSHVYFEAEEDQLVLRYRVDGVCNIRDRLPKRMQKDLIDKLKYSADVNLAQRNISQQGVIVRTIDAEQVLIYLGTIPGEHGESIMLSMSSGPKCTLKGKALKDEGKRLDIPGAAKMKADDLRAAVALHL